MSPLRLLQRLGAQLLLLPCVALASYSLMANLPWSLEDESKRTLSSELIASYRRDLGLGETWGFLRPWQKLWAGERLGTSAQGVTGEELLAKLGGSAAVGSIALGLALLWAWIFVVSVATLRRRGQTGAGAVLPAVVFGTPVFLPALLLAPAVVERGHGLAELSAALVLSLGPGLFLGSAVAEAFERELLSDYVRTARAKGLPEAVVLRRHVLPNVLPALLDAIGPVATALLAGSFAAERVFGLPYFGQLYVLAVVQKQVAVVAVATTLFAGVLVAVNLGVEVLRAWVDPRSREGSP